MRCILIFRIKTTPIATLTAIKQSDSRHERLKIIRIAFEMFFQTCVHELSSIYKSQFLQSLVKMRIVMTTLGITMRMNKMYQAWMNLFSFCFQDFVNSASSTDSGELKIFASEYHWICSNRFTHHERLMISWKYSSKLM